jgi:hypothetical protein
MMTQDWIIVTKGGDAKFIPLRLFCSACGENECVLFEHANEYRWMARVGGTVTSDRIPLHAVLKMIMAKEWDVRQIGQRYVF